MSGRLAYEARAALAWKIVEVAERALLLARRIGSGEHTPLPDDVDWAFDAGMAAGKGDVAEFASYPTTIDMVARAAWARGMAASELVEEMERVKARRRLKAV